MYVSANSVIGKGTGGYILIPTGYRTNQPAACESKAATFLSNLKNMSVVMLQNPGLVLLYIKRDTISGYFAK
jgi:hypothetical protein